MKNEPLGRLVKMNLRSYWQREDTHFTPWLAQEENIALLGETIGMELEVQNQEVGVGPFRADILCRNTADNTLVVIENQLERTDHTHLGQLLTYAAGLDAVTLVWVVGRFTEEHRAALDWLNRNTDDDFHFFGLEVELWKIGESVAAPKFNLVAKPNEWSKTVKEAAARRGEMTPGGKSQVEYWTEFGAYLDKQGARFRAPKPYPSNWMAWGLGRAGIQLLAIANAKEIMVGVDIDSREHPTWYRKLEQQRDVIEAELGFELEWAEKPLNKFSMLRLRNSTGIHDKKSWPRAQKWMLQAMDSIDRVFRPHVKELDDAPPPEMELSED